MASDTPPGYSPVLLDGTGRSLAQRDQDATAALGVVAAEIHSAAALRGVVATTRYLVLNTLDLDNPRHQRILMALDGASVDELYLVGGQ